jgi:uncharacterized phage protein gp47/JayE
MDNNWLGPYERSYQQVLDTLVSKFKIKLSEITNFAPSEPLIVMLSVWAGIAEQLGYYINTAARELFLNTLQRYKNAVKWAEVVGYRIRGVNAASGVVKFYFETPSTANVLIPAGTKIQTKTGIVCQTTENASILIGQSETTVTAIQLEGKTGILLGNSNGLASQKYALEIGVVDGSVSVFVNGVAWQTQNNFLFSYQNSTHLVAGLNVDKKMSVAFGDGIKGAIPNSGAVITANYAISRGSEGNLAPATLTEIISSVTLTNGFILKVTNPDRFSGGTDVESLASLKMNIPLFIATGNRAVTEKDYIDTALLAGGVAAAGVRYDCGKFVDVYIAPQGGGIASDALRNAVKNYFEDRKMVTTQVAIRSAGLVICSLELDVFALNTAINTQVEATVRTNLLNFFAKKSTRIGGSIRISDIYQVVEESAGVDASDLLMFKALPYARALDETTPELDWTRSVVDGSTAATRWTLRFITATQYQLLREGVALGAYNVGQIISNQELSLVVNQNYTAGQSWEFYTYRNNANLFLQEPSMPYAFASDIVLHVTGGL